MQVDFCVSVLMRVCSCPLFPLLAAVGPWHAFSLLHFVHFRYRFRSLYQYPRIRLQPFSHGQRQRQTLFPVILAAANALRLLYIHLLTLHSRKFEIRLMQGGKSARLRFPHLTSLRKSNSISDA